MVLAIAITALVMFLSGVCVATFAILVIGIQRCDRSGRVPWSRRPDVISGRLLVTSRYLDSGDAAPARAAASKQADIG